jgi:alkanesulfonate monooxygenase SsuD/methylene tetrahydromethanopterin reductase-like flavin-dependent oxidoreductase (luciferase family)
MSLHLGLDTFGDIANGPDGRPLHPAVVIREVMAEGELADRLGLDFFGIGEHHRDDYAISAPDIVLAGLAGRTERIRLGTSVTVLSSDDPIRVFQRFSTLDAISGGRAEITVGRGSFIESFPRSSTCSRRCSRRSGRSPGRARCARRSTCPSSSRRPRAGTCPRG